jgi:predicted DNA-binding antitoxin AbrB/MazE fold protein
MSQHIDAVFENGVFRPEQPVNIVNGAKVSLTIDSKLLESDDLADIEDLLDLEFMESCRKITSDAPLNDEVHRILGAYKGSLSDLVSEERDER